MKPKYFSALQTWVYILNVTKYVEKKLWIIKLLNIYLIIVLLTWQTGIRLTAVDHVLFPISIFTSLTSVNWSILIDDLLCLRPSIVEPDGAVSKIVVFSGEVLGKQGPIR